MGAPRVNQGHAVSRFVKIGLCRHAEKRSKIDPVPAAIYAVVSGQEFERQQVADGRPKPGQDFQSRCRLVGPEAAPPSG